MHTCKPYNTTVKSWKGYENARWEAVRRYRPLIVAWPSRKQVDVDLETANLRLTPAGRDAIGRLFKQTATRLGIRKSSAEYGTTTAHIKGLPTDFIRGQLEVILTTPGHLASQVTDALESDDPFEVMAIQGWLSDRKRMGLAPTTGICSDG